MSLIPTRVSWAVDIDFDPTDDKPETIARRAAEHAAMLIREGQARLFDVTLSDGSEWVVDVTTGTVVRSA